MIIAVTGPVKSDIESIYEFITLTNEFKYVDLEDCLCDVSDNDYQKYVLNMDEPVVEILKGLENEYGTVVVYSDSAISPDVYKRIVKDGIVIVSARKDTSTYKETPEYKLLKFTSIDEAEDEFFGRYDELFNSVSKTNQTRAFFCDMTAGSEVLYDVVDLIESDEIDDSKLSEIDCKKFVISIIEKYKKQKKEEPVAAPVKKESKKINDVKSLIENKLNGKQDSESTKKSIIEPKKSTYEDVIKNAMNNLGMSDIANEITGTTEDFPMNKPEVEEKPTVETKVTETKNIVVTQAQYTINSGITLYLPKSATLEYVMIDGVEYAALTLPASFPLVRTPIIAE